MQHHKISAMTIDQFLTAIFITSPYLLPYLPYSWAHMFYIRAPFSTLYGIAALLAYLPRSLAAALVEGEHEVQIIRVDHSARKLTLLQKLAIDSIKFPCASSWDIQGRLWVVGGPPLDTSKSLHLGAAARAQQGVSGCLGT
jgi:hypothetical protein